MDGDGARLARARVPEGLQGLGRLHALMADHAQDPEQVMVGIETDRGLLVAALVAAGYQVYAVNPKAVSRYRDRHTVSGTKSDGGDVKVLADLVCTDRHGHRRVAGDSDLAQAIAVSARALPELGVDPPTPDKPAARCGACLEVSGAERPGYWTR